MQTVSDRSRKRVMQYSLGVYGIAVVIVMALFLLHHRSPMFSFIVSLSVALLSGGAIPLFVIGLQNFKNSLRKAFAYMYAGIVLYSLAPLQFPFVNFFHLQALANTGIVIVPYIAAVSLIFWGVRGFGRLLQLRGFWFSPLGAFVGATLMAVLAAFLPHVHTDLSATAFATVNGLNIWCGSVLFFGMMGLIHIRRAAATRYHLALGWLIAALGINVFAAIHYTAVNVLIPSTSWYAANSVQIPAYVGALCFMMAGYSFTKIKATEVTTKMSASPVDVLLYVASLASNPRQIDASLDDLREITSQLKSGSIKAQLSNTQETRLATTYRQIEDYLVTAEPLQEFTRPGLREIIRTKFQFDTSTTSPFWKVFIDPTLANQSVP